VSSGTNALNNVSVAERIVGGSGNNTFTLANGANFAGSIDGGTGGTNALDYSAWTADVIVNLFGGAATGIGGAVSNIRNAAGGSGSDMFIGDANANTFTGGAGDDYYYFFVDGEADTIVEAAGGGSDTLDYSEYGASVTVNLATGTATDVVTGFANIENVVGSTEADTITGDANANYIAGRAGNDILAGGGGNDTYIFKDGWGTDTITDSAGTDTLDFSAVTYDLTFTIHTDGTVSVTDGTHSLSHVAGVEKLVGGKVDNTFVFENGAAFAGTIDGGDASPIFSTTPPGPPA
jgi:Ca2+-binding RTX toxin-like protein